MAIMLHRSVSRLVVSCGLVLGLGAVTIAQPQDAKPFEPVVGQAGKDVVWVPSPEETVEKMLDIGKVTPQDYVIDLGSGDGRNVIQAAKRGARGHGVEYNPDMVEYSRRRAKEAGVADRATFVQGDMYEADISKATILPLFLLTTNLERLRPKFLELRPGTRIVSNTFTIPGWEPVYQETLPNCSSWCTVLLYIVPAKVAGAWQTPQGTLTLQQEVEDLTGTLGPTQITEGRVRGEEISFTVGGTRYTGRVKGNTIEGTAMNGSSNTPFRATRAARSWYGADAVSTLASR